jgi:hypothetical protein
MPEQIANTINPNELAKFLQTPEAKSMIRSIFNEEYWNQEKLNLPKREFKYETFFSVTSWSKIGKKTVRFSNRDNEEVSIELSEEQAKGLASVLLDEPGKTKDAS